MRLIERHSGKRAAAIGDGGNDVSMIQVAAIYYHQVKVLTEILLQAASVGIGIVGKEGKQASLAADFSITQVINKTRPQYKKGFPTNNDAMLLSLVTLDDCSLCMEGTATKDLRASASL